MEQLLKRLREQQVSISLVNADLKVKFNGPALSADLLATLKSHKVDIIRYLTEVRDSASEADLSQIPVLPPQEHYPLSSAQSRVWVLSQFAVGNPAYNMPGVYLFEGDLNFRALEEAFNALIARHEILRTVFRDDAQGEIRQFVLPIDAVSFQLDYQDLRYLPDSEAAVQRAVQAVLAKPFDLSTFPLLRAGLLHSAAGRWVFTFVIHHIISDGWSMDILMQELSQCYDAYCLGATPALALTPLLIQYKDYTQWQNEQLSGKALEAHRSYWLKQLSGDLPVLALASDRPRPTVKTYCGGVVGKRLGAGLVKTLKAFCQERNATLFMGLLGAVKVLLYRYTGQTDLIIGTPIAGRDHLDLEDQVGLYINTLALRTRFSGTDDFGTLLNQVRQVTLGAYEHQLYPFDTLVDDLQVQRDLSRSPLFDVMLILQSCRVSKARPTRQFGKVKISNFPRGEHTVSKLDLTFDFVEVDDALQASIEYNSDIYHPATASQLLDHLEQLIGAIIAHPSQTICELDYLSQPEKERLLYAFNDTATDIPAGQTIVSLFGQQVHRTPDHVAVVAEDQTMTYRQLQESAGKVAAYLLAHYPVKSDTLVAIRLPRSEWMLAAMLGVLTSGAAYLPIDPAYPPDRISYLISDSGCIAVLDEDMMRKIREGDGPAAAPPPVLPEHIAYCIYTSGTTGNPKGCLLTHANVVNFFRGMNDVLGTKPGTLLSMTNYTFDISVLELIWTLTLGYKVIIQGGVNQVSSAAPHPKRPFDFSLFYFGNANDGELVDPYQLLLDGARYADRHGYAAVWIPERHFHEFGGLYPSASVLGAAVATVTERINIRAGSVVLPLHHPLRVAEEWSVIDNLSGGRVGIACASGWHASDFVLAPDKYQQRHTVMYQMINTIKQLWRGETVDFEDGNGTIKPTRVFPKPQQAQLPLWITSASSIETFISAGKIGANVLTHMLGETVEGLSVKITAYREAYAESGFDVSRSRVSLMLHTYIGEDAESTHAKARQPFMNYLRTSTALMKTFAADLNMNLDAADLSAEDLESLLTYAYNRYVSTASLIGTEATCQEMLDQVNRAGVDEIACLIDFGVNYDDVMQSLKRVTALKASYTSPAAPSPESSYAIADQMIRHRVTHLQATPSMAMLLKTDGEALQSVRTFLLGGEQLLPTLVSELHEVLPTADLYNMYGPTETTIWSTCAKVARSPGQVTIGKPIANTQIYILDPQGQLMPPGAAGEIYIAGKGVARGYVNKPVLTAERFLPDSFRPGQWMYRTGDYGRWLPDGSIAYIGRQDDQVKVHGYRIELGEVEDALLNTVGVKAAAVLARETGAGDKELVAYLVGEQPLQPDVLHDALSRRLPAYMVPRQYIQVPALLLTPNGKVDKKRLPDLEGTSLRASSEFVAARNEVEAKLTEIWIGILGHDKIGIRDNFFDLGGNSIKIVRMVMQVNKIFNKKMSVATAFRLTHIDALAAYLTVDAPLPLGESDQELDTAVEIMEKTFSALNDDGNEE